MERVTIDAPALAVLGGRDGPLELCDESGQTVGYYVPAVTHDPSLYRLAESRLPVEELQRRRNEPEGRTTAEVLRRLESL